METFYDRHKKYMNLLIVSLRLKDGYLVKRANDELKKMESSIPMKFKPTGNYYSKIDGK